MDNHSVCIQAMLDGVQDKGGKVYLPAGKYEIDKTLLVNTSSSMLEGEVWACNVDPNGVFESPNGTKLKLKGNDHPAILVGKGKVLSGTIIKNIGIQGDIAGMDTRGMFDIGNPSAGAGLFFDDARVDQAEFSKISFCGLGAAICAKGECFVDACTFEKINTDGCCIGVYFAPKISCYTHFRQFIVADTPSYGFFLDGTNNHLTSVDISDIVIIRNGGASQIEGEEAAAVYFKNVNKCIFRENTVSQTGVFWYFAPDAKDNFDKTEYRSKAIGLLIVGNENKVYNNCFSHSSCESMVIRGNGNVLVNNTADGDVVIEGRGNAVHSLVFTSETGRLILKGEAANTTSIFGVPEERIVRE